MWLKIFYRNSLKNWLHTLINVFGLALGLLGLIIVLLYYNDEKSYDQWNPNKDTIYKVGHAWSDGQIFDDSTKPEGPKSAEIIPEITAYYRMPSWYNKGLLKVGNKTVYTNKIIYGKPNFFDFFPHPILEGDSKTFLDSKDVVVISEALRQQLFKNENAVGEQLKIDNTTYTVSGVFKLEEASTTRPSIVMNKDLNKSFDNNWGAFLCYTYYKVKEGTDIAELEKKLQQVFIDNYYLEEAEKNGLSVEAFIDRQGSVPFLEKLNGFRLHSKGDLGPLEGKGNYRFLMIMLALSILIIVISCINFVNLSIASASQRAKEVGIKKTLGISNITLKFQYVLEIIAQCIIALIVALIATELILPTFNNYLNTSLSLTDVKLIVQIICITIILSLIIGSIFGLYLSNFKIIKVLKGNFSRSQRMVFVRNMMLGLQFVVSGFFLIGGLVVYNQVSYMNAKELGFSGEQIMAVDFSSNIDKWNKYELVKQVLGNDPQVISVTTSLETPGRDEDFSQDVDYLGKQVDTKFIPVDYGYFEMIQTKMAQGRSFSSEFASDSISGVIFNETAIKQLGIEDPIGKKIRAFSNDFNIVGVVKDYHTNGLDKKIRHIFYLNFKSISWLKNNVRTVHFKLKPEAIEKSVAKIENFWKTKIEPGYPFSYTFVDKQFEKTHEKYKQQQTLFGILTFVVIFIALLGLFALATLTIQQRLKEVAIRKTLGASVKEIMQQLTKSFVKITFFASIILLPISYYFMQNWLNNFAYRIDMPFWPYIIAPIVLVILVFIVVGLKAYKATKIDLIKYLKFE